MVQGHCPICGKAVDAEDLEDSPSFPFCSERCRLVDLGRWIDGNYVVPGASAGDLDDEDESPDPTEPIDPAEA